MCPFGQISIHCKKSLLFSRPHPGCRTDQTLPGREKFNYYRPGAGDRKIVNLTFFTVYSVSLYARSLAIFLGLVRGETREKTLCFGIVV
jgi:hypothetical protein